MQAPGGTKRRCTPRIPHRGHRGDIPMYLERRLYDVEKHDSRMALADIPKVQDCMRAYQDKVQIGVIDQKVATTYKSHRRVFDSKLNSFSQAANLALTELEKLWKARTEKRQENATRRAGEAAKGK